jgi:hypothetical protein
MDEVILKVKARVFKSFLTLDGKLKQKDFIKQIFLYTHHVTLWKRLIYREESEKGVKRSGGGTSWIHTHFKKKKSGSSSSCLWKLYLDFVVYLEIFKCNFRGRLERAIKGDCSVKKRQSHRSEVVATNPS